VFIAIGIQHAMRMGHFVTYSLPGSTVIFHIISKTPRISKKKVQRKTYILVISTAFSEQFLILKRNEQDVIKNVYWS